MVLSNGASPLVGQASAWRADFSTALDAAQRCLCLRGEGEGGREEGSGVLPEARVFVGRRPSEPPAPLPLNFLKGAALGLPVSLCRCLKSCFHLLLYIHLK